MINNMINNMISKLYNRRAFTLIEIVIYCAIFLTFAVTTIQMMIWLNFKLQTLERTSLKNNEDLFLINFSSTYSRLRLKSDVIERDFKRLIASSSVESVNSYGVKLNKIQNIENWGGKNKIYEVFDSISF